jgi:hypothetical protein
VNHGPHPRQALPAPIEENILCSAVARLGVSGGVPDNCCPIIKPINVIPEYLAKMLEFLVLRLLSIGVCPII